MILAGIIQETKTMEKIIFFKLGPKKVPKTTIRSKSGTLIKKSIIPKRISSKIPPKYPATIPIILPPTAANKALEQDKIIVLFAP